MLSVTDRRARVKVILRLLEKTYGRQIWKREGRALDVLVEAMLAQNTNLANAQAGYKQLRRRFRSWRAVMDAEIDDVQRQIAVCGLARMRARRLQALLRRIFDERGKLDLAFLNDLEPDAAFDYLIDFHGIGPKTAAYTLLFAFGMPLFPVDNGILRVARRLRLVRLRARDAEVSQVLSRLVDPAKHYPLHILMFKHAKTICRPRNPMCSACPLLLHCPDGQRRLNHRPMLAPLPKPRKPRAILSRYISSGMSKDAPPETTL